VRKSWIKQICRREVRGRNKGVVVKEKRGEEKEKKQKNPF